MSDVYPATPLGSPPGHQGPAAHAHSPACAGHHPLSAPCSMPPMQPGFLDLGRPSAVAPELAAAMAETRAVRDGYQALCGEFGPSAQSGWSARISLTILNRHRVAAGLDRFSRTESNQREDITMRYRRERDEAREQAEQVELERDEARHQRDACRERNAAIAVQLDQYRDERDNALAAIETLAVERDAARDALGKILRGRSSGEGMPLDDDEIIAIASGVLGAP